VLNAVTLPAMPDMKDAIKAVMPTPAGRTGRIAPSTWLAPSRSYRSRPSLAVRNRSHLGQGHGGDAGEDHDEGRNILGRRR